VLLSPDLVRPEHLVALDAGGLAPSPACETALGSAGFSLREVRKTAERQAIYRALRASWGNKSEAARILRTDYKTLHLKMKRYRIEPEEFQQRRVCQ
jgi:DNA-binding NtrC family response regulator